MGDIIDLVEINCFIGDQPTPCLVVQVSSIEDSAHFTAVDEPFKDDDPMNKKPHSLLNVVNEDLIYERMGYRYGH